MRAATQIWNIPFGPLNYLRCASPCGVWILNGPMIHDTRRPTIEMQDAILVPRDRLIQPDYDVSCIASSTLAGGVIVAWSKTQEPGVHRGHTLLRLWSPGFGTNYRHIPLDAMVKKMAFSTDGSLLAVYCMSPDNTCHLRVFQMADPHPPQLVCVIPVDIEAEVKYPRKISVTCDNSKVVVSILEGIIVFDIALRRICLTMSEFTFNGEEFRLIGPDAVCHPTTPAVIAMKSMTLKSISYGKSEYRAGICFLDIDRVAILRSLDNNTGVCVSTLKFCPNGKTLVTTDEAERVHALHLPRGFFTSLSMPQTMSFTSPGDPPLHIRTVVTLPNNASILVFLGSEGNTSTKTLIVAKKWSDKIHRFFDAEFKQRAFAFMCVMEYMRNVTEQQKQQKGFTFIKPLPLELSLLVIERLEALQRPAT